MGNNRKDELKKAYRAKPVVGGVYRVRCSGNGRVWVKSTADLDGIQNRFAFAVKIRSCPDPAMQTEWAQYGVKSRTTEILDRLGYGGRGDGRGFRPCTPAGGFRPCTPAEASAPAPRQGLPPLHPGRGFRPCTPAGASAPAP